MKAVVSDKVMEMLASVSWASEEILNDAVFRTWEIAGTMAKIGTKDLIMKQKTPLGFQI